jgi:hypothetical protein
MYTFYTYSLAFVHGDKTVCSMVCKYKVMPCGTPSREDYHGLVKESE